MESTKIVLLSVLAAIAYGILHDQVTARVCVEYFTIGHPPIFGGLESPTALGFGWGVLATWWVGLLLGAFLAVAARTGPHPKLVARDLAPGIARLLAVMGVASLLAGVAGYGAAARGFFTLDGLATSRVPPSQHVRFIADLWAHSAAYATGFVGGLVLCVLTWIRRARGTGR